MKSRFLRILTQRDYWPLFGTMSLGAFNDNFLRQALLATLAFGAVGLSDADKSVYGSMATGLMIAPFFLFSSLAGQLADKRPKSELVKLTKVFEAALMAVAAILFSLGLYYELLIVVFLMGLQSTFFGPLKYGLLPEILAAEDLVAGNGLVSGVSFFSIVLGSMAGSWLAGLELGPTVCIPVGLVVVSLLGLFFALRQPASSQATPTLRLEPRLWRSTWEILSAARGRRDIWLAILAISWFWAMGSILLTQAPVMAATVMGATHEVGAFLVTSLALGVAVGSLSVQRLLKGRVSAALAPTSAAALAVLSLALAWSVAALPAAAPLSVSLTDFLADWTRLRVGVLCFLVSAVGGIFVVPLNAILQHRAEPEERARVVAANNVMNSLFIVVGSLLTMLMIKLGLSLAHVFLAVALSAAAAALLTFRFLPEEIVKQLIKTALRLLYRPKIKGLEHFPQEGPALLFPNHTSFIDVALLACWLPRRLSFAIDLHHALRWWIKPFLRLVTAVPVNPAHPLGARALAEALARGEAVVVFPEGRLTTTGGLMKIYEGVGLLATLSPCPLTPVVFQGLEYTRFGRLRSRLRCQPRRLDVSMTVFPPERLETARRPGETRRDLRRRLADHIYDLMALARFRSRDIDQNLFDALKAAVRRCGGGRTIFEDWTRRKLTYGQVLRLSKVLGRALARLTAPGEFVGLMLPNSAPLVGALFGLWAGGRVPVMLNWSQGRGPLLSALKTAQVGLIVTSRRFAENPRIQTLLADSPAKIVFLEDLKLSARAKLAGLLWRGSPAPAGSPAAVVFTSGSEGAPKGVALSHRNLLANIHQAKSFVEINEDDVLFNPMPAFHAFGLNVGLVLPLVTGMRSYSHVNPLHVKAVPELIYDVKATVVVGTDAFAAAWGRNAHPYDFHDVRFMLVGAEKLKASTAELYVRKLNLRLFEGYGVTEASPILALGSRMRYRDGSVGRFLPDLEWRLDPAPGLAAGGRLAVRGPNVMLGYLLADRPGEIQPPPDGWHVTGDVVEVDDGGFVWLRGRLKRFAKISGEMVSLAAVEEVAGTLWPGRTLAVLARPDLVRGERLTLVVAGSDRPDLGQLRQAVRAAGLADLCAPKSLIMIKSLPMTPLGKVNLPALEAMTAGLEPEPGAGGVADDEPDDELGGEPLSELGGEPPAELEGPSVESRAGGDCSAAGAGSNGQQAG